MSRSAGAAVAALAALTPGAQAMSASETSRAASSIDFRITIPPIVIARTNAQMGELSVTTNDVGRGYVDLEGATSVRVTTNDDAGYGIAVMFDPSLLSRVLLRIQQQTVGVDSPGERFHLSTPRMIDTPIRIGYRLYLAAGVKPGKYRWPVALRFEPVP